MPDIRQKQKRALRLLKVSKKTSSAIFFRDGAHPMSHHLRSLKAPQHLKSQVYLVGTRLSREYD